VDPLRCAIDTAHAAGRVLLDLAGASLDVREKQPGDLVTRADRESEALVVGRLRAAFPRASLLAEESGAHPGDAGERWIVDPLDGTTNFAHGYPFYSVSIAYEREGEVVAGVVHAPALGETFVAARGSGTTRNGTPVRVSATAQLRDALVCTGFIPSRYERNGANFARLSRVARGVRRDGSAALDLANVACGRFDAFWEYDLRPWDVAAGALLVREAGGAVTATDGAPFDVAAGSIAATNGATHGELTRLLVAPANPRV